MALIFILIVTFVNQQPIKNAKAATYTYTENFLTTTYKDTLFTNGKWDTALGQANLLRNQLGGENVSNTGPSLLYQVDFQLDASNNPFVVWGDGSSGVYQIFFSKLTPGVGWTKMDGTLGHEVISNPGPSSSQDMQILLDSLDNPYVVFSGLNGTNFTRWTVGAGPGVCGVGINDCWTNMRGNIHGAELLPLGGSAIYPRMALGAGNIPHIAAANGDVVFIKWTPGTGWTKMDGTLGHDSIPGTFVGSVQILLGSGMPYLMWDDAATNDTAFAKWTVGAGPAVCGAPNDCWTNMAGDSITPDNISNDGQALYGNRHYDYFQIDSSGNPYIVWHDGTDSSPGAQIYFAKWTPGPGFCPNPLGCWTKMDGVSPSPDNISDIPAGLTPLYVSLHLDNLDNPYVVWSNSMTGNQDVYFSRWTTTGCGGLGCWTSMIGDKKCFFGTNNGTVCTSDLDCTGGGLCRGFDNLSHNLTTSQDAILAFDSVYNPYVIWTDTSSASNIAITKWTAGAGPGVCGGAINDCWTNMDGTTAGYENPIGTSNVYGINAMMIIDSLNKPNIFFINYINPSVPVQRDVFYTKYLTGYTYRSTIQSLKVNTPVIYVDSATLTTTQTDSPPDQTIDYYLSNNGGLAWEPVTLGVDHVFSTSGNDLRWRAVLHTTDSNFTPVIDDLTIDYSARKITCSVSPTDIGVGGVVDINSTLSFVPTSITAQVVNNGNILATIPLVNIGGNNYSAPLATAIEYLGTNTVTVSADDPGPPETVTCGSSFTVTNSGSNVNYPPAAPTNFACTAISSDTIRWTFSDNATDETGFRLYGPEGLIYDTGPEVVIDLDHFDEINLETNSQYVDRYVTAFSGIGESAPSNKASCYTLAKTPLYPSQLYVDNTSIIIALQPNDGNPPNTEYAIRENISGKYILADGTFGDTEIWQTNEGWGGTNGVRIIGTNPAVTAATADGQLKMALTSGTNYSFSVKARNGDGIETEFSSALGVTTAGGPSQVTFTASKGVAVNLVSNLQGNLVKIAKAASVAVVEPKYILLLRELSFFLSIIIFILIIFLVMSLYKSFRYLSRDGNYRKGINMIWSLLTKDPAEFFSDNAQRDEKGTFKSSYEKHRSSHIFSRKTLMHAFGLIFLKIIILAVLVIGLSSVNHHGYAQGDYNDNGMLVNIGDKLSYIITVENHGLSSASNVNISDVLNSHLEYQAGSAKIKIGSNPESTSGISFDAATNTLSVHIGDLPSQTNGQLTFDTQIKPGSAGVLITNVAVVSGDNFGQTQTSFTNNQVYPPPPGEKFSCNSATGSCVVDENGPFTSISDCQNQCSAPVTRYACGESGACTPSPSGAYGSLEECQEICQAPLNNNTNININTNINTPPPPACVGEECGVTPPPSCTGPECGEVPPPPSTPVTPPPTPPTPINELLPAVSSIIEVITSPVAKVISQDIITPILLSVAAVNTIPIAVMLTTYLLPYLNVIFAEPLLFLFRKKRKKWGVVYNSLSKVPVDLAVIRLYDKKDNRLVQTRVTDRQGRYILIVKDPGSYYISASKGGFAFPTRYLSNEKQDARFIDLYHGEPISVSASGAVVTANIPLDPVEKTIRPEREVVFGYLLKNTRAIVSYVGLILAALIFLVYPTLITGISIATHLILFVVFRRLAITPKPKSWGIIYDQADKKPLHYAIVRIFDTKFNKLLETQVTDSAGRYSFLVGQNQYQLLAEKEGYQSREVKPLDLTQKEEIVNLDLGLTKA